MTASVPAVAYTFTDYLGETIYLSAEVYKIILAKHREVHGFFDRVGETLQSPDMVRKSVSDARARLYYRFYADVLEGKFVAVVVKRADRNFISTVYATDKIKEGEIIWQK